MQSESVRRRVGAMAELRRRQAAAAGTTERGLFWAECRGVLGLIVGLPAFALGWLAFVVHVGFYNGWHQGECDAEVIHRSREGDD